ncbi:MerR family transcriptional regulator [Herbaspirillum sp.]|jgi:MerR family copper efflux transcriptional regulator|uniref:MerR family transcriptional regulator n=1 Tax=Herbaspirillum TaxID=963 RepID=UPI00258B8E89|nr:MerR family transcriptional regulator [Herbaspirillum sp.]MCP3657995.1 MerR family transcriptional regulator [Herbaspirillum sp.]MCP3946525.1 MerR family transcriptional regulator [Herbaspirillum sp.]MCP4029733.1 MerR family transcriptional regulator [Herbaspirillum sp.]MCP4554017.1 MerR family transcriptional regulator [Herbaspirillum sp.]
MKTKQRHSQLSIGELANSTGASIRAIRHYDEQGLLASTRSDNGYRMFSTLALTQVKQLRRFLDAGFNLAEIKGFPECMLIVDGALACPETKGVQRTRLLAIDKQITELQKRRLQLRSMLEDSAGK